MTRFEDMLGLVVKSLLVLLILGLIVALFLSIFLFKNEWSQVAGGAVSIAGITAVSNCFFRYDTLTRATRIANNLDPEMAKMALQSITDKSNNNG